MPWLLSGAVIGSLVTGLLFLAAGLGPRSNELGPDVERELKAQAEAHVGLPIRTVACPPREVPVGGRASCTLVAADGSRASVPVTRLSERGTLTYELGLVPHSRVIAAVQHRTRLPDYTHAGSKGVANSTIDCPTLVSQRRRTRVTCRLRDGDQTHTATVDVRGGGAPSSQLLLVSFPVAKPE